MRIYARWLYKRTAIWLTLLVFLPIILLLQIDINRSRSTDLLRREEFRSKFVTKIQGQQQVQLSEPRVMSQVNQVNMENSPEIGVKALIARSKLWPADSDPVLSGCPMYAEFRGIDFTHSALRSRLCSSGVEAYRMLPGDTDYPVCRLQQPFDANLMDTVKRNSETVSLFDASTDSNIEIFAYHWPGYISSLMNSSNVTLATIHLATRVPDVTFLDLGCSIGVDSIRAARLGLPVVALDANIRDLLRLRLSLEAASLDADLVWNFVSSNQELKRVNFPNDLCKIGNDAPAMVTKRNLVDTIPVMPIRGDKLGQVIRTKNLVIKMGIDAGSEADFLSLSESLFTDFTVAAVQMDWRTEAVQDAELAYILKFFTSRDYKAWKLPDFRPLNANGSTTDWGSLTGIIWIHSHFLHLTKF